MSTSSIRDLSLQEFEDRISSDSPTPGGGALAAVTVSFAAALLQMTLRITGKKQPGALLEKLTTLTGEALTLLRGTADEDIAAFDSYLTALRLPNSDVEDQAVRAEAKHSALLEAARVPLEAAGRALDLAELALQAKDVVVPMVFSDLGTAIALLQASANALLMNVETNLSGLQVPEDDDEVALRILYQETSTRRDQMEPRLRSSLGEITRSLGK